MNDNKDNKKTIELGESSKQEIKPPLNLIESQEDIKEITLIGGCTRTPKIQQMIEERFKKKPLQNVNAEEIVAQGAAYSYL